MRASLWQLWMVLRHAPVFYGAGMFWSELGYAIRYLGRD